MKYEEIYIRAWQACSIAATTCWDEAHSSPDVLCAATMAARDAVHEARALPTAFLPREVIKEIVEFAEAALLDLRGALSASLDVDDGGMATAALIATIRMLRGVIETNSPPTPPAPADVNRPARQLVA